MAALPGVTWNETSAINEDRQTLKITVDVVAYVWSLPYIKYTEVVKKTFVFKPNPCLGLSSSILGTSGQVWNL